MTLPTVVNGRAGLVLTNEIWAGVANQMKFQGASAPVTVSRRTFVAGGLAAAAATAVPMRASAAVVAATPARRFVDSVGICTHPHWGGTLWDNLDWESAFIETRVMNTRGKMGRGTGGKAALSTMQTLFSRGVKMCVTVTDQANGLDRVGTKANLDFLADYVGVQNISGIESANEYSNPSTRPTDWATQLRSYQKWLHDTVRANSKFNNIPLIAPSIWGRLTQDYITLGNLEPNVDRGCMHWYPSGRRPSIGGSPSSRDVNGGATYYTINQAVKEASVLAPTKPLWITEYGHAITGPNDPLSGWIITETAAAKYFLRGLFDAYAAGVQKTHIYSLIDDVNRSKYHGLMDGTLRKRKTFYAVRNLMTLFADSSTAYASTGLDITISNAPSSIRRQLFQKSNGSYLLIMYQDVDSYDRANKRDTSVPLISVGLNLTKAAKIEVINPTMSLTVVKSVTSGTSTTIPVGDHVTVVRITPGTSTTSQTSTSSASEPAPAPGAFEFRTVPQ